MANRLSIVQSAAVVNWVRLNEPLMKAVSREIRARNASRELGFEVSSLQLQNIERSLGFKLPTGRKIGSPQRRQTAKPSYDIVAAIKQLRAGVDALAEAAGVRA